MIPVRFEIYNANKAVIKCPELLTTIREKLSVANKNASIIKKKTGRTVNSRIYCITKGGKFEVGMFKTIKGVIDGMDIPVTYEYSDDFRGACVPQFNKYDVDLPKLGLTPHDYQEESVKRMLKFGRGCILVGTGGGKTFIMALLTQSIIDNENKDAKFLIIVPTIQLVEQTYTDFLEYGYDESVISRWSGSYPYQGTQITIASVSILQSSKSDLSILKDINVLIVDEVHILKKGNGISKLIEKVQTHNRFGFTGTLPEETVDHWNIFGTIGPILYEKAGDELRKEKYITDAKIDIVKVNYNIDSISILHTLMDESPQKYIAELEFMIEHEFRNNLIAKSSILLKGNSLIMVDRIIHGEILEELLRNIAKDKDIYFIQGQVAVDDREYIRKVMEENDDVICIAISKIFSTGINIKNIHNIIFATPGKAKVKLIQSIGRGLRLHENKSILRVVDFADNLHYSNRHLRKREALYASEKLKYEIRTIKEPI